MSNFHLVRSYFFFLNKGKVLKFVRCLFCRNNCPSDFSLRQLIVAIQNGLCGMTSEHRASLAQQGEATVAQEMVCSLHFLDLNS